MRIASPADKNGDGERPFGVQFAPLPDGNHRLLVTLPEGGSLFDVLAYPPALRVVPDVEDHDDAGPFVHAVALYQRAGWGGTLPLPARQKHPPPAGFTGHKAPYPSRQQLAEWMSDPSRQDANIGLRLAGCDTDFEIVGIDVDHYAIGDKIKLGGDQLDVLQDKLGALPETWTSSARSDGVSGIRFFRVPRGLAFRGQAGKDIEIVSKGYRFAVVWPSIHPSGDVYTWYRPGNPPGGASAWSFDADGLPNAADLPELPQHWIDHLTTGRADDDVHDIDNDSSVDELHAWADATFNDGGTDSMCARVSKSVEEQCECITAEATSHDKIVNAHYHLYRLAAEGHTGWRAAIQMVEATYRHDVIEREKRDRKELRGELFRSRTNALRKVKGQVDRHIAIGAVAVPPECTCPPVSSDGISDDGTTAGQNADDTKFDAAVEHEARKIRVRDAARQAVAREQWTDPEDQGDLAHQIANPDPDPGFLVDGLIPARGFVLINAQYKVGKSTLASVNLARSLVTGQPFLRRFDTKLGDGENVGIWNLEVDKPTLVCWLGRTGLAREAQARIYPMSLRGNRSVDFDNDLAVDWTIRWLADRNVKVWIIDPLSKLYRGEEKDNSEFNRWWLRAENIAARAGVRVVVLVHHTGHDENTADRARGASAMMGNPDVLVTYRHDGKHGALPKTSKRYLSAFGRNVHVPEFEIDFDPVTNELRATGSGANRQDADRHNKAVAVWRYLESQPNPVPKTRLLEAVGLPSTGKGAAESREILAHAERSEWVTATPKPPSILYSIGSTRPVDAKIVASAGKQQNGA